MRAPVIEFRQVGLTYPGTPPVEAFKPADLRIENGEYVTVIGPSGSGKSTFLNIAGLLDGPTGGRYLLDGIDTAALTDGDRAALRGQRIGFVFQSFHLLPHRSAAENVALAMLYAPTADRRRAAQRRGRARDALAQVGLSHRINSLPTRLSGGERQRVAIARALVGEPSLLLCDEPTGNLDTATAESILGLLDGLHSAGLTIVLITHDPQVAARAERTVAIRDGILGEVASL
ncbi:ABC transporter ATP-binding protein [Kitasatospora purpeofusca]|uniref:ABC transporter ATP-binding protein n=1 Tax=Kitasatospora purpeofusca TaxID=67352 RepID=UPI003863A406|nr:ABC transporter ATP-binding protein [Kitasatospora purpeofusca]